MPQNYQSPNNPWKTQKISNIYKNNWIELEEHRVITPAGTDGIYSVVKFRNLAIGVVPLDEDLNTWIVGQYRYPLKSYSWEIPEGGGNPEIPPEVSAARELQEETGITATRYTPLLKMHLSNSATDELAIVFLATGLKFGSASPEETEQLAVRKLPFEALYQMVQKGEVTDAISVAAVLKLKLMLLEGQLTC